MCMGKKLEDFGRCVQTLSKENPEKMGAFHKFMEAVEKEGALSVKVKELIALALGIKAQCTYCIAFHLKGCLDAGATREEIMEASWVAALMGGGPSLAHLDLVIKGLEEFKKE